MTGGQSMVRWEHLYLLGTMVFTVTGTVVRDFDEEYEAWTWLEGEGWGLVAIEPPDPIKPGMCKYYFKRQRTQPPPARPVARTTGNIQTVENLERHRR